MKRILTRYEAMSGQVINFRKSLVTFSPNTTGENRTSVCNQLEVKEATTHERYLGIPLL